MPSYHYECLTCLAAAEAVKGSELTADERWEVVYETEHAMTASPEQVRAACVCPRCASQEARLRFMGNNIIGYVKGNGYLDKAGCHRDMNMHKLTSIDPDTGESTDPYTSMREPGEVEDLKVRLRRSGQHNPRPMYFTEQKGVPNAAPDAAATPGGT